MIDDIDHVVHERDIMGNQDKAVLIVRQIALQPLDMLDIQKVGRFVQNQNGRILQEQFGEQHFGPLSAAQIADVAVQSNLSESQSVGHLFDLGIQCIEAAVINQILQFADVFHHFVEFVRPGVSHPVVDRQHLRFPVEHLLKRSAQYIADRFAFAQHSMLVEVTDRDAVGPLHLAGIRLQLAGDDAEKRGLPFPVRPDQAHMFALQQPE